MKKKVKTSPAVNRLVNESLRRHLKAVTIPIPDDAAPKLAAIAERFGVTPQEVAAYGFAEIVDMIYDDLVADGKDNDYAFGLNCIAYAVRNMRKGGAK